MITCSDDCEQGACCDGCLYFDFNGDEDGNYIGDGYCIRFEERVGPGYCCEYFYCVEAD